MKRSNAAKKNKLVYIFCIMLLLIAIAAYVAQPLLSSEIAKIMAANVFQCSLLAILCLIAGKSAGVWLHEIGFRKREIGSVAMIFAAVLLLGMGFLFIFFRLEKDIKTYDFSVYWIRVIQDREIIGESISKYLIYLRNTFGNEYNHLAVFPLLPLSHLFGVTFRGYCASVFVAYYLPACLLITIFVMRLYYAAREKTPGLLAFFACFLVCAGCVPMLWPVMNGYLDVSGVLIIALMLNFTLHWDILAFDWKKLPGLIILSVALLLTRRWYAYYIVGYYFARGLEGAIRAFRSSKAVPAKLGLLSLNLALIAGISSGLLYLLNPSIFTLFFGNDYSSAYSAFKTMNLWGNLWAIVKTVGVIGMLCAAAGAFLLLRSGKTRSIGINLLVSMVTTILLFTAVQDMAYHHHYLVLPTLLIFIGVLCVYLLEYAVREKVYALCIGLATLVTANFAFAFLPAVATLAKWVAPSTTSMRIYPKVNVDYDAIQAMVADLSERTANTSRKAYVVGDAASLSPELLKRALLPQVVDATPFVLENCNVDLRDGFPSQLFLADFVLLTEPFRTEFQATQQVSYQPYDMLLNDPVIAQYYTLAQTYDVSGGRILLYEKTRPLEAECVDVLRDRLETFYPEEPFVYEPNYFIALLDVDHETAYSYNFWDKTLTLQAQASTPARMQFNGTEGFETLSFFATCWMQGLELLVENQTGVLQRTPLSVGEWVPYQFDIAGSDSLTVTIRGESQELDGSYAITLYAQTLL